MAKAKAKTHAKAPTKPKAKAKAKAHAKPKAKAHAKAKPKGRSLVAAATHAERFERHAYDLPVLDLGEAIALATATRFASSLMTAFALAGLAARSAVASAMASPRSSTGRS
jgi:hypothetical protein